MPKLSIIIPVYNAAPYLAKCLDSILNQKFQDWELIIVDDASTDDSRKIIAAYAASDKRIRTVLHEHNLGVGAARNTGLAITRGEFLAFVDADDWLETEMYEALLSEQRATDADIVECNIMRHKERKQPYRNFASMPQKVSFSAGPDEYYIRIYQRQLSPCVYNKIFRSSVIKAGQFTFVEDLKIQSEEDFLFLLLLAPHLRSLAVLNQPYYNYLYRANSLSHDKLGHIVELSTAFFNYCGRLNADQDAPADKSPLLKKIPALAFIVVMQVKLVLFYTMIQEKKPIARGAQALATINRLTLVRESWAGLIGNKFVSWKDMILVGTCYFGFYRLAALFFYLNLIEKRGRPRQLYQKDKPDENSH